MTPLVYLREAAKMDAYYFYALRVDPVASRMSRRRAPTWEEHVNWWEHTADHRFVACNDDGFVGTLRLSPDGVVSIIVDPKCRGMGYGTPMLQALEPYAKRLGIIHLMAEIAYENERSQRVFTKAGYRPVLFERFLL